MAWIVVNLHLFNFHSYYLTSYLSLGKDVNDVFRNMYHVSCVFVAVLSCACI